MVARKSYDVWLLMLKLLTELPALPKLYSTEAVGPRNHSGSRIDITLILLFDSPLPSTFGSAFLYDTRKSSSWNYRLFPASEQSVDLNNSSENAITMSTTLLRSTPALRGALRAGAAKSTMGAASAQFVRGKATLPDLSCKSRLPVAMPRRSALHKALSADLV